MFRVTVAMDDGTTDIQDVDNYQNAFTSFNLNVNRVDVESVSIEYRDYWGAGEIDATTDLQETMAEAGERFLVPDNDETLKESLGHTLLEDVVQRQLEGQHEHKHVLPTDDE